MQDKQANGEKEQRREPPPDLLERSVSWVSMALVLALAAFLVREGLQTATPPTIETRTGTPWQSESAYYIPVAVMNEGDLSVQGLRLRAQLMDGPRSAATKEVEVAWLPAHSRRHVVVVFERDPRQYDLRIVPVGFEEP